MSEVPALVLECTGMPCPRPIIELGRHIGDVEVGDLIGVRADDPAAAVDVPAWCRMRGQEFLGTLEASPGVDEDGPAPVHVVRRLS